MTGTPDAAEWRQRSMRAIERQRLVAGETGPYCLPHARSAAERDGQVQAIEWEQRISGSRVHIIALEEFAALELKLQRRFHILRLPLRKDWA